MRAFVAKISNIVIPLCWPETSDNLAGGEKVYRAGFSQAGNIPSDSLREAFQIGEPLSSQGYPHGNRAIVITNAGGFTVLSTDYAEKYGIDVVELSEELLEKLNPFLTEEWSHENPMDRVGDAASDRFAKVFDVMIDNQDLWDIAVDSRGSDNSARSPPVEQRDHQILATHAEDGGLLHPQGERRMKRGVSAIRDGHIPNFVETEEAFRAIGKSLASKYSKPR